MKDVKSYTILLIEASSYLQQAANYLAKMIDKENEVELSVTKASMRGLSLQITKLSRSECDMRELQKIVDRTDKIINQIPPIPKVMQNAMLARDNLIRAMSYC